METKHLKIFVAVYKTRSFTKASELLFTSQPTISEHIRNLESHLQCKLFDRLGRSIMPTRQADVLYSRSVTILDDLEKLEEEIHLTSDKVSGELTIGASTVPGAYILPRIAAEFKEIYPDISFEIRISDSQKTVEKIAQHELLLGVVGTKVNSKKVLHTPFIDDKLIVVAATKSAVPAIIEVRELLNQPFLLREEGSGTRNTLESLLLGKGIRVNQLNTCAVLGSNTAIKEAVKANLGISILSKITVQEELNNRLLKEISIVNTSLDRNFHIVTAQKRSLPNQYQVFFDYLRNHLN